MKSFSCRPAGASSRLLGLAIAQAIGAMYAPVSRAGSIMAGSRVTVGSASDLPGDISCSLRDAIAAVKAGNTVGGCTPTFTVGVDRIDFDPAITPATITLQNGPLVVDSSLSIRGPGSDQLTLTSSAAIGSIINNETGSSLTLSNFTVADSTYGSCIANDSGGTLTLNNMSVRDCYDIYGGGVSNSGMLQVNDSTFTMNTAGYRGGVIFAAPGAQTTISNSMFSGNTAASFGGAISNQGSLNVEGGVIEANRAIDGGGIHTSGNDALSISATTFQSNESSGRGGALFLGGGGGSAVLSSVTLSDNTSNGGAALFSDNAGVQILESTITGHTQGAVAISLYGQTQVSFTRSLIADNSSGTYLIYARSGTGLQLRNTTVSNNYAASSTVLLIRGSATLESNTVFSNSSFPSGTAISLSNGATLEASNNIIAGHSAYDCVADIGATITVNNHNIFQTGSCGENAVNNIIADPQLGPLSANGGPTRAHALLAASPAIDAGDSTCDAQDQRGFIRVDGQCDIGAFELGGVGPDLIFTDGFGD